MSGLSVVLEDFSYFQQVVPARPDGATCASRPRCRISTADGTAYVANVGFDLVGGGSLRTAAPVRVDPSGTTTLVADDLHSPNGAVILGDTLVVAETLASRISAFDIRSDGSLSPRAATGRRSGRCPPGARSARCSISSSWRRTASPPAPRARSGRPTRSTGGVVRAREGVVDEVAAGTGCFACVLGGRRRPHAVPVHRAELRRARAARHPTHRRSGRGPRPDPQ